MNWVMHLEICKCREEKAVLRLYYLNQNDLYVDPHFILILRNQKKERRRNRAILHTIIWYGTFLCEGKQLGFYFKFPCDEIF